MPAQPNSRLGQVRHGPGGGLYRIFATADSTQNTFFGIECVEPPGGGCRHCIDRHKINKVDE